MTLKMFPLMVNDKMGANSNNDLSLVQLTLLLGHQATKSLRPDSRA